MANVASIDLDSLSARQLTELIQAAEQKRQEKAQSERLTLIQEMTKKAEDLGLTLEDLVGSRTPRPAPAPRRNTGSKPVAAKFRGPNGEEWTGRGRMPNWLVAQVTSGRKRDDFLIK
jgi:DNA-binding protein H-NS